MNFIKILLLSTLTFSAFASDKFVCQEYDRKTEKLLNRTVTLNPTGPGKDKLDDEGKYEAFEIPYSFKLYEGIEYFPTLKAKGTVLTEDVWFEFTSNDSKIKFSMYLDELEESGLFLTVNNGVESSDFICRLF